MESGLRMKQTRYWAGFIDHHPSFEVSCDVCKSDVAMFCDIETFESVCLNCCDDIWFARMETRTLELYVNKWNS